jgi:hypothetical protein
VAFTPPVRSQLRPSTRPRVTARRHLPNALQLQPGRISQETDDHGTHREAAAFASRTKKRICVYEVAARATIKSNYGEGRSAEGTKGQGSWAAEGTRVDDTEEPTGETPGSCFPFTKIATRHSASYLDVPSGADT